MDIDEYRKEQFRKVVELRGGVSTVSKLLGYKNPSFISQMLGPKPTRKMTEKSARRFERDLGLPPRSFDPPLSEIGVPVEPQAPGPALEAADITELVASVIRMVGTACEREGGAPGPEKFAAVVALAYRDAVEHRGELREGYVRQMATLLR